MAYRILIWSRREARMVDHEALDMRALGETALDRLADAGRAALGLGPRRGNSRRARIAAAHRHIRNALRLIEDL
ncbi:MAG: hypothetical protein JOY99_16790 [Sphingomonadaceae bacterium]|nr:hypothetical protein [Sphingomonadaceae bacterium]